MIINKEGLPEGRLFRGGSIDYVKEHSEIQYVKTILNLRNGSDYQYFDVDYFHFPMSNKVEKYDTTNKEVRIWLNSIIRTFEDENLQYPILIHCLSGKYRTGIVVSAILMILGIYEKAIAEEYLLSEGEVKLARIHQAIDGMKDLSSYFDRVDLNRVKKNLLG